MPLPVGKCYTPNRAVTYAYVTGFRGIPLLDQSKGTALQICLQLDQSMVQFGGRGQAGERTDVRPDRWIEVLRGAVFAEKRKRS